MPRLNDNLMTKAGAIQPVFLAFI